MIGGRVMWPPETVPARPSRGLVSGRASEYVMTPHCAGSPVVPTQFGSTGTRPPFDRRDIPYRTPSAADMEHTAADHGGSTSANRADRPPSLLTLTTSRLYQHCFEIGFFTQKIGQFVGAVCDERPAQTALDGEA